jgi:lipopolysaccharide transport system permease protein
MNGFGTPSPENPLVIRPSSPWWRLNLAEIWQFREMLYFLVWRNVKVRYKQTMLGVAWVILQPLAAALIFTLVFSVMVRVSVGYPYILFSFSAMACWTYFSGALMLASNSLVNDSNLIRKVYFPRLVLPITSTLTGWVDCSAAGLVLLVLMRCYGVWPGFASLSVIFYVLLATLTAFAFSLWLSALDVQYHDIRHVIPFLTQIWMFLSPVILPVRIMRRNLSIPSWAWGLNPMSSVITGFQSCMGLGAASAPPPDAAMLISSCTVVGAVLVTGLWYFKRTEKFFADVV